MHTGKTTPKPLIILAFAVSTILIACLISQGYRWWQYESIKRLTDTYGTETKAVIQNFELRWFSLDAHRNPSIQSKLATELYLNHWGFAQEGQKSYDEPYWLITKSVNVTRVRLLEYSPERFKAVAQSIQMIDEITPAGEYMKSFPYDNCGVYVFFREDGTWKLAAYFNASLQDAEKDWNYIPPSDSRHQIIGDIPDEILYDCEGYLSQ